MFKWAMRLAPIVAPMIIKRMRDRRRRPAST
jgi:hypothetical protein